LDFGTYDGTSPPGGAPAVAKALNWAKNIVSIAGNHTAKAYLSNEVSSTIAEAIVSGYYYSFRIIQLIINLIINLL